MKKNNGNSKKLQVTELYPKEQMVAIVLSEFDYELFSIFSKIELMIKTPKAVIFDLDGTLLDTIEDLMDSTNHALESCGLETISLERTKQCVGNGLHKLAENAVPQGTDPQTVEKVFLALKTHYAQSTKPKTRPYENVVELMELLEKNGIKTAIVSNKPDAQVKELRDKFFMTVEKELACGEKEGIKRKPAPDGLYWVMDKLNVTKDETIYVGDSEVDLQTAKNTGIECINVLWGFRDKSFLEKEWERIFGKDPIFAENCNQIAQILGLK